MEGVSERQVSDQIIVVDQRGIQSRFGSAKRL